jgi:hypothetical protein
MDGGTHERARACSRVRVWACKAQDEGHLYASCGSALAGVPTVFRRSGHQVQTSYARRGGP